MTSFRLIQTDLNQSIVLNADGEEMFAGSDSQAEAFFQHLLTPEEKEAMQIEHELDIEELHEAQANRQLAYTA